MQVIMALTNMLLELCCSSKLACSANKEAIVSGQRCDEKNIYVLDLRRQKGGNTNLDPVKDPLVVGLVLDQPLQPLDQLG